MEFIFKDLVTKCWWSWVALAASVIAAVTLASSPVITNTQQAWLAIFAYVMLCIFFMQPLLIAAKSHKHLLTVCVWSFVLVLVGIALVFYAYYRFAEDPTKYDKLLNVVPVFVAIWAAALGWLIHFRLTTKAHRTNNAFAIIMEMRKSTEILKKHEMASKHFPPGTTSIPQEYHPYFSSEIFRQLSENAAREQRVIDPSALDKAEAIAALRYMLNYFEFMAVGIRAGDLDEDLLYDTISTTVVGMVERSSQLIDYARADRPGGAGQPLAMVDVSDLAQRWRQRLNTDIATRANGFRR